MAATILSGIYAIRNRATNRTYIGSATHIILRWRHHRKVLRRGTHHSRHLQRAWNKYGELGFDFLVVEEVTDHTQLVNREQHWIDTQLTTSGLYNVCPVAGNTLGRLHTDSAKAKMRATNSTPAAKAANRARQLGRTRSPETNTRHRATLNTPECRERLRLAQLGRKATPEAIEKNRLGQLGRRHSEATKAKMRANGLNRRHSAETKLKISIKKKGKKLGPRSPEHTRKLSMARIGTRLSEETKAKIGLKARLRGPISAETKAKISAYQKGRVKTPEHLAKIEASKRVNREMRLHQLLAGVASNHAP